MRGCVCVYVRVCVRVCMCERESESLSVRVVISKRQFPTISKMTRELNFQILIYPTVALRCGAHGRKKPLMQNSQTSELCSQFVQ